MEFHLKTPIPAEDLMEITIGDIIYLTGVLITARDEAHKKALQAFESSNSIPVDFEGKGLYHCGPLMKRKENDSWTVVAAGPTTSQRMEIYEDQFIRAFHPSIIIGKGGMGKKTAEACKEEICIYANFTGGAALIAADKIKKASSVHWFEELGMAESLWVFEVENFGPLIVTIDTNGNNLIDQVKEKINHNKKQILGKLE